MRTLVLEGTPAEMGEAFGATCRAEIAEFYRLRVATAADKAKAYGGREVTEGQLLAIAEDSVDTTRAFDQDVFNELQGIARGADRTLPEILALGGLTDYWDAFAWGDHDEAFGGCTAVLLGPERTTSGRPLFGQTWDLATDNQPFVLMVVRRPRRGPATWALTCTGCLSLMGLNDAGVAVGTTNLRTPDARAGVTYTLLLHRALACSSSVEAEAMIGNAHRSGAHFYALLDGERATGIEASPHHLEPVNVGGAWVQGNHCRGTEHCAIEAHSPVTTSPARVRRMGALLSAKERWSAEDVQRALADTEGGGNAISRDDLGGVSSNGAVVVDPGGGRLWACHGPPHRASWVVLGPRAP